MKKNNVRTGEGYEPKKVYRKAKPHDIEKWQQAIALDGQESAALLVHYGDILHAMGEQFMAEIYWRKGLEKGYDADQITRRMEQGKAEKE